MLLSLGTVIYLVATFIGLYVGIFFLSVIYEHWGRDRTRGTKARPRVCVIIPCYNEERTIGRTIESLLALDYPRTKLEIIVVDDGSRDRTYAVAKGYAKHGITVLRKENGGKHTALNYALTFTDAPFVGALDADSTVAPDSLRKIISYFKHPKVTAVTPSLIIDTPRGVLRRIQAIEFMIGVFLRRVFTDIGSQHVTPGPFTIYRRKFFDKYGAWHEAHKTEDIEVALRIQSKHLIIENATDAYVYTHGPETWNGLYQQRLRWYHGFLSNVLDYKHLFGPKHGNLGLFVLPMSFVSIATLSLVLLYTIVKFVADAVQQVYQYWLIGFDVSRMLEWHIDTFFFNTGPLMILGGLTLAVSLIMLLFAKRFSGARNIVYSYVLFVLLYCWFFILWWAVAGYHKAFKRDVAWGHKSIAGG